MVVPSSASYAHELTSHAGSVRGELGVCCRECKHESLLYLVQRVRDRVLIRPLGHRCAGRGLVYAVWLRTCGEAATWVPNMSLACGPPPRLAREPLSEDLT